MPPFLRLKQHARHLFPTFLLVIVIAAVGLAVPMQNLMDSAPFPASRKSSDSQADQDFVAFTDALFLSEVSGDAITLHYTLERPADYGITAFPDTLGTFSTDANAVQAGLENVSAVMDSFDYKQLTPQNQLTFEILSSYFENLKSLAPYVLYREPLAPYTGITSQLPVLLSEYAFLYEEDVEHYLVLLEHVPEYYQSLMDFEQAKADHGLFMNKDSLEMILADCQAFIDMKDNYLLDTFTERLNTLENLPAKKREEYKKKNELLITSTVIPAYETLCKSLQSISQKVHSPSDKTNTSGSANTETTHDKNQGLCNLPQGKEYYAALVENVTGSGRTISQIQTLISKQLLEDVNAFQSTVKDMDGKQIASSALNTNNVSASTKRAVSTSTNPASVLESLKQAIPSAFPMPKDTSHMDVQVKSVPQTLEPYLSPAFYMIPALDTKSSNTIYINKGAITDSLELYTTLAHEGFPGHLYQTNYFVSTAPSSIRHLLDFGGYVEGWATYGEMCSYYLSNMSNAQATLLQKHSSIMLGLYASTDIGVHYENWSLEDTKNFWAAYGITNEEALKNVYQLVIASPANYLKYYVGYVEFLELKKQAIKEWGDDFTQKRFHKKVLEIGPAPFSVIRDRLN